MSHYKPYKYTSNTHVQTQRKSKYDVNFADTQ